MKTFREVILSNEQFLEIENRLRQLEKSHRSDLGEKDIKFISDFEKQWTEYQLNGYDRIKSSFTLKQFLDGVDLYAKGRIFEFFEGHNILHHQYTRFKDQLPQFDGNTYTWDACPGDAKNWKYEHNILHHQYTNILGGDPDLNFGMLRVSDDIKWKPTHLLQLGYIHNVLFFSIFSFGPFQSGLIHKIFKKFGITDDEYKKVETDKSLSELLSEDLQNVKEYINRHFTEKTKDETNKAKIMLGLILAEIKLNIHIGKTILGTHIPEKKFPLGYKPKTKGEWYVMQIESTRNFEQDGIDSIKKFGGLNYQIEHHLFPTLPSWRYEQISKDVQNLCKEFGIEYKVSKTNSDLWKSLKKELFKYSFPDFFRINILNRVI